MNNLQKLTLEDIRRLAPRESYELGEEYYACEAITYIARRANIILAEVGNRKGENHRVKVTFCEGGIEDISCSCGYDWGGFCKHRVAVLITYVHEAEEIKERRPIEGFANLTEEDIAKVFDILLEYPRLLDQIEDRLFSNSEKEISHSKSKTVRKDREQITRKQIRKFIKSLHYDHPYQNGSQLKKKLLELDKQPRQYLEEDDGKNCLNILLLIIEELQAAYESFEDVEGCVGDYVLSLAAPLAESIFSANFTKKEKEKLLTRLEFLHNALSDYGLEISVTPALLTCKEGWQAQGQFELEGAELDLSDLKLNVLERREKDEDFFNLAHQSQKHLRYALKLLEKKELEKLTTYTKRHFIRPEQVYPLVEKLHQEEYIVKALHLAEWGLSLPGDKYQLGNWMAENNGAKKQLSLKAALDAFRARPTIDGYKTIRKMAGKDWSNLKEHIASVLQQKDDIVLNTEILIAEKKIDKAIEIVENCKFNTKLLRKVAKAAISIRPDWIIRIATPLVEDLIARSQIKYYTKAVEWVSMIQEVFLTTERSHLWEAYFKKLKMRHKNKRSLLDKLEELSE